MSDPVALRRRRRSPVYLSPLEHKRTRISFAQDFRRTLTRPFLMLFKEPIVACFCAYMTVVVRSAALARRG